MEFYEYQIHKYKPIDRFNNFIREKNNVYKFGELDDSPDIECNRVGIEGSYLNKDNDTQRTTCDPLTSLSGGNTHTDIDHNNKFSLLSPYSTYDIENFNLLRKIFFSSAGYCGQKPITHAQTYVSMLPVAGICTTVLYPLCSYGTLWQSRNTHTERHLPWLPLWLDLPLYHVPLCHRTLLCHPPLRRTNQHYPPWLGHPTLG
jgi:hypothetical protein